MIDQTRAKNNPDENAEAKESGLRRGGREERK